MPISPHSKLKLANPIKLKAPSLNRKCSKNKSIALETSKTAQKFVNSTPFWVKKRSRSPLKFRSPLRERILHPLRTTSNSLKR